MRFHVVCLIVLGAAISTSCAPLQQAPLVYASGFDVGVHVGTTAASPSPEIQIGARKLDAAYVPVAVAKACDKDASKAATNCINEIYKLKVIEGDNDVRRKTPPPQDQFNDALLKYQQAQTTVATTTAAHKTAADALADAQSKIASSTDPANAPQLDSTIVENEKTTQAKLDTANNDLAVAFTKLQDIVVGSSTADDANAKKDALSVYGTFNADTKASATAPTGGTVPVTPTGGLTIGQTFSTGVAAQNLTEGLRDNARAVAIATCLASAHTIYSDLTTANVAGSDKQLNAMVTLCGATIEK